MAADLGFDGVEVMVWTDPVSQDPDALRGLSDRFGVPILAIHAPVPAADPAGLVHRPVDQAGAGPRGRRDASVRRRSSCTRRSAGSATTRVGSSRGWPGCRTRPTSSSRWRTCSRGGPAAARSSAYLPHWDLLELDVPAATLDLSHTAVSGSDAVEIAGRARRPALPRPPRRRLGVQQGRAPGARARRQPCAEVLERLARRGYAGIGRPRGQHPARAQPRRARGRPRRGTGLRPAQPRGGGRHQRREAVQCAPAVRPRRGASTTRSRPDYPAQLFDALESAMGQPLLWSDVLDVGAGTGIATRALAGRGRHGDRGRSGAWRARGARARGRPRGSARSPATATRCRCATPRSTWCRTPSRSTGPTPQRSVRRGVPGAQAGGVLALWWNRHDSLGPWMARVAEQRLFARLRPAGACRRGTGSPSCCGRPVVRARRDGRDPVVAPAVGLSTGRDLAPSPTSSHSAPIGRRGRGGRARRARTGHPSGPGGALHDVRRVRAELTVLARPACHGGLDVPGASWRP